MDIEHSFVVNIDDFASRETLLTAHPDIDRDVLESIWDDREKILSQWETMSENAPKQRMYFTYRH